MVDRKIWICFRGAELSVIGRMRVGYRREEPGQQRQQHGGVVGSEFHFRP